MGGGANANSATWDDAHELQDDKDDEEDLGLQKPEQRDCFAVLAGCLLGSRGDTVQIGTCCSRLLQAAICFHDPGGS